MRNALIALASLTFLAACGDIKTEAPGTPQTNEDARRASRGKLTGEEGMVLFGGKKDEAANASPLAVNSFLWRSTLDTLSFMPLASADPFGGVIITDWYEDPKSPGERFKVNALILDKTLRADGIKITVFKQQKNEKNGSWRDQQVDATLARKLEDTILTRARELRMQQR
jgi:hypothetical protein